MGDSVSMSGTATGDFNIDNFDEEDFRSFLLGVRFLVQNNERISLANISTIFERSAEDPHWRERLNGARWKLNDFLDVRSFPAPGEGELVFREYLETFLYGKYAHRSPKYAQRLRTWEGNNVQYLAVKLNFLMVLNVVLKCAGEIADGLREWMDVEKERLCVVPPRKTIETNVVVPVRSFQRRRKVGQGPFRPTPAMVNFAQHRLHVYKVLCDYMLQLGSWTALNPHNEQPDSLGSGYSRSPEGETMRGEILYGDSGKWMLFEITYGDDWETVVYLSSAGCEEVKFVVRDDQTLEPVLVSLKRRRDEILGLGGESVSGGPVP
jgi:hypothetical protein